MDSKKIVLSNEPTVEKSTLRIVEDFSAMITGKISNASSISYLILVLVYKKGSYLGREVKHYQSKKMAFTDAVNSSIVTDQSNSFGIHLPEAGIYEIHFAGLKDVRGDGEFLFCGMLNTEGADAIDTKNIRIEDNSHISLDVSIKGFL